VVAVVVEMMVVVEVELEGIELLVLDQVHYKEVHYL
jgi:hypothetical protein|tara:strand:- start:420 stop:527 length:108 start_codon:yes stop_codon:yes gene_type:complete